MPAPRDSLTSAIGGRSASALEKAFGMRTVDDLLGHYPRRYAERAELTDMSQLQVGEHATVLAEVKSVSTRPMRARRGQLTEVVVTDGTHNLTLTFFNQAWLERTMRPGRRGLFSGKVGEFARVQQLSQPDYVLLPDDGDEAEDAEAISAFARPLIPVYPASAKVTSWSLSKAIDVVLDGLEISDADDPIPESVRRAHGLMSLPEALVAIHRPDSHADVTRARARLKWDEALVLQVILAQRRRDARALPAIARAQSRGGLLERFDANLPFELTDGQNTVGAEIAADLALDHPMHRLLQGEVGSGKTICAVRAMLAVIDAGGQAALLAPTEVLAAQHARSISAMLGPMAEGGRLGGAVEGTRVALITG